jgi:hypothetical protein
VVNAPSTVADGFSGKLGRNRLAWRPMAGSRPEVRPMQDDARRGNIPIENAAAFTAVRSLGQGLGRNRFALGTGLGCSAWINQRDDATGPCCLVADVLNDLIPPGVVNRLGEHPARQSCDIEILKRDVCEAVDQRPRELMREIPAPTRHTGMQAGHAALGLSLAVAVSLFASHRALGATKCFAVPLSEHWGRDGDTCGQRHETGQSQIHANRTKWPLGILCVWYLDLEADEPLVARAGYHCSAEPCANWQIAVPPNLDFARNTENAESPAFSPDDQPFAYSQIGAVKPGLGTEPWEARLLPSPEPPEERGKGLIQSPQYLLFSGEGKSSQALVSSADCLQFQCLLIVAERQSTTLIRFDALLQGRIVKITERPEHAGQSIRLRAARIEPVFKRQPHSKAFRHPANYTSGRELRPYRGDA